MSTKVEDVLNPKHFDPPNESWEKYEPKPTEPKPFTYAKAKMKDTGSPNNSVTNTNVTDDEQEETAPTGDEEAGEQAPDKEG